jgi:ribonuclease VapC
VVVDASVILAVFFAEAPGAWAAARLTEHAATLQMSTVNLAETLVRLRDRQPKLAAELEERLLTSGIRFVPPNVEQARLAAQARLAFPLNLGDCFAYALAKSEDLPLLTLGAEFRKTDLEVVSPPR